MVELRRYHFIGFLLVLPLVAACCTATAGEAAPHSADSRPLLIHLNGIGGRLPCDSAMVAGLRQGGIDAETRFYDWTGEFRGLPALQAIEHNRAEAQRVAEIIVEAQRERPGRLVYLTSHSGGTGIAAWALEALPEGVQVEALLMLAPALSPQYDLSKALRHVRRGMYVFTSVHDKAILSAGTRVFGTIDGIRTEAAGINGFVQPATADAQQYRKVMEFPYRPAWFAAYGHMGTHVCPMRTNFAKEYLAPLLLRGRAVDEPKRVASTQPVAP